MNGMAQTTKGLVATLALWGAVAAAGILGIGQAAWAAQAVDSTIAAQPDSEISIEAMAGRIRIYGWNQSEVKVTGEVGDDIEFSLSGERGMEIEIEAAVPDDLDRRNPDVDVDLEIWVPASAAVDAETISASIEVQDLNGQVSLESVSGSLRITGSPAQVEAESVSGAIELSGSQTDAEVETVSGSIVLDGVAGKFEASSVSGGIQVTAQSVVRGSLESVSGSVTFAGAVEAGGRLDVESHSGNVDLDLAGIGDASFSIETFSGDIDNAFGPEPEQTSRHAPGKVLEFSEGSGGARVSVETFSGNVTLRR